MSIALSDEAKDFLGSLGYDPIYGARPLKRVLRQYVENPLSKKILQGEFREGDALKADLDPKTQEQIIFSADKASGSSSKKAMKNA